MSNSRSEEIERLNSLIANASASVAAGLLSQLELLKAQNTNNLPIDEMIATLREKVQSFDGEIARFPNLSRLFFEPFDVLFVDKYKSSPLPGSFKRDSLGKIWEVIKKTSDTAEFNGYEQRAKDALSIGNVGLGQNIASELRSKIAQKFFQKPDDGFFNNHDRTISFEDSKRFIILLQTHQKAKESGLSIDFDIENLSRAAFDKYMAFFKELENTNLDLAAELMISIMANSSKPWMTLRILKSINPLVNDRKLDATAYKIVGDRLLGQIREFVTKFNDARNGDFDGEVLAHDIETYNKFSHGFEREEILSGDGPWQKELFSIRARATQLLIDLCQRSLGYLQRALPIDRTMVKGKGYLDIPRTGAPIDDSKYKLAYEFSRFIRETRLFAPLGGFKVARETSLQSMLKHCDALRSGLTLELSENNKGKYFDDWARQTIEITRIVDDEAAAKSFERRIYG
ncbi:hypothetical protein [Pseudaquidulcibacter saccharophilus]|uniref:hypothetical protein n=1 Tax=Pseudaquidulcibacter saccharophilus TaxID=2831900 RepID=UPI001EFEFFC0|nr:hypothetical protein [Pseudaquidulcibacter saccharophilus]